MKNLGILIIGFFLVGGICLVVGMNITKNTIIYEEVEKEQQMLMIENIGWQDNADDDSEVFFSYWIYNFGDVEAKNVTVRCEITDVNEVIIKEEIFNIGNVASTSYKYKDSIMKYSDTYPTKVFGACYFESADGDHINLEDRLSDLE